MIDIDFYRTGGDEPVTRRRWPAAPRIGDHVRLRIDENPRDGECEYLEGRVVYAQWADFHLPPETRFAANPCMAVDIEEGA